MPDLADENAARTSTTATTKADDPMTSVQERVARGAAWLDETRPGWRDQINLTSLTLWSNRQCVLGQTFHRDDSDLPGFSHAIPVLCGSFGYRDNLGELGFNCPDYLQAEFNAEETCAYTEALMDEWRRVIHQGRVPVAELESIAGLA